MNKNIFTLSLISSIVLLAGCSFIPKNIETSPQIASQYTMIEQKQDGLKSIDIAWQDFFQDKQLQYLINLALENNRDLKTAALNIQQAQALYNIQSADSLPSINGSASFTRARTISNILNQPVVGSNYQVGVSLASFELDFFGRVKSLNQAALNQYLATEEAYKSVHLSLISEVAKAYLSQVSYSEQLILAQNTYKSREDAYKLAKQRLEGGISSALELSLNETLVQSAKVSLLTLHRQLLQSKNALTLLVGKPIISTQLPQGLNLAEQNLSNINAGLPAELLANRPDIRSIEKKLKASNANIGAARAAFFPRISLTSGIGLASGDLSDLFKSNALNWSFMPQLVLPIFEGGRNNNNLKLAEIRKNLSIIEYEKTIQTAFREVSDALVAKGLLKDQINAQIAVEKAQTNRLNLVNIRYKNGISNYIEVLDAQRELFTAQQNIIQTRLLDLVNTIDLYKSLGGGLKSK